MDYPNDDFIHVCKQLKVDILRTVDRLFEHVSVGVNNKFTEPYQELKKIRPRKDFIRPVTCMVEKGKASVRIRWIYFIPNKESGALESKMVPRDFKFYRNGRFNFSGVPNMTPELRDIMEDTNLYLSFVKKTNKHLIKMNRSLNELMKVLGVTAQDIELSEDELIVFNMEFNPVSEVELNLCYELVGEPSSWSQEIRERFSGRI